MLCVLLSFIVVGRLKGDKISLRDLGYNETILCWLQINLKLNSIQMPNVINVNRWKFVRNESNLTKTVLLVETFLKKKCWMFWNIFHPTWFFFLIFAFFLLNSNYENIQWTQHFIQQFSQFVWKSWNHLHPTLSIAKFSLSDIHLVKGQTLCNNKFFRISSFQK